MKVKIVFTLRSHQKKSLNGEYHQGHFANMI